MHRCELDSSLDWMRNKMNQLTENEFSHCVEFSVIRVRCGIAYPKTMMAAMIVHVHCTEVRVEVSDEIRRSSRFLSMMQIEVV